ncbi:hypothetical protein, partial [Ruthenibacterium lactatiformans]
MIKNKTIKRSTYRLTLAHKVGEVHIWCQKESLFFHVNPNLCRLAMGSDWFINEEKIFANCKCKLDTCTVELSES